jgi:hypothetical protein
VAGHLFIDYGWVRSYRWRKCVDRSGHPVPWFTYPAIDFLSQLDLSEKRVFEYGAGFSTLYWALRAKKVVSIESDPAWYEKVRREAPSNCDVILSSRDVEEYSGQICRYGQFDVIVVDGTGESRPACCELALAHVRAGGIVILDNSDLWLRSASILREGGLIQADFTGFAPLSSDAHTTSVFFTRQYDMRPRDGYQPHKSVAQPSEPWPGV